MAEDDQNGRVIERWEPSMAAVPPTGELRSSAVLAWAECNRRPLPWRFTRDPWAILVSEVMAQQTQVERVVPKWHEFLRHWPTPQACAQATLGDVLRLWSGLGYPRRAKHLHAAAHDIAALDRFPDSLEQLMDLPGVGGYTARAVLAFAFERDVAVVDTNTARIFARWENQVLSRTSVQRAADAALPLGRSWEWNQGMLDLGATICVRRNPRCSACPVSGMCAYRAAVEAGHVGNDPADGTAGVSVAQTRFADSDRQLRGRLLRLAAQDGLSRVDAAGSVGKPDEQTRVDTLINGLIGEGLLCETGNQLHLP